MPDDAIGDFLGIIGIDLLRLESCLPSGFIADGPFALERHARLGGEVRTCLVRHVCGDSIEEWATGPRD